MERLRDLASMSRTPEQAALTHFDRNSDGQSYNFRYNAQQFQCDFSVMVKSIQRIARILINV